MTVPPDGLCRLALSSRLATSWCSRDRSAVHREVGRVDAGRRTSRAVRSAGPRPPSRRGTPAGQRVRGASGAMPASTRDRSSRSVTSPLSRSVWSSAACRVAWSGWATPSTRFSSTARSADDRGAQLVRDVGDQVAPLPVHRLQVGGHRVERPGQLADLVVRRGGDPAGVVAGRHPPGRRASSRAAARSSRAPGAG